MVLLIHKEVTDQLDLNEVANDFVSKNARRLQVFGKFWLSFWLIIDSSWSKYS